MNPKKYPTVIALMTEAAPGATQPSKSRPFTLFQEEEPNQGREAYIAQFVNPDNTFDIYEVYYHTGSEVAEMDEIALHSASPYVAPEGVEPIHDYEFQDRVGAIELIRLIFELADPSGETDLETDGPISDDTQPVEEEPVESSLVKILAVNALPITEAELLEGMHSTAQSNVYYRYAKDMPQEIQNVLKNSEPVVINSAYTVFEPMAFIREIFMTSDGVQVSAEISLGNIDDSEGDQNAQARSLWENSDFEYLNVYVTLT